MKRGKKKHKVRKKMFKRMTQRRKKKLQMFTKKVYK